ncbi:unnamed protein product [Owenia fusiformis]|uniref:Uncharacterized protein n=1 Tax=Owenia fusiformis TaxID=6347 RepID=A0A8J1TJ47_OWEFU|nr:unnamed protein product [Owenia fusiformis]
MALHKNWMSNYMKLFTFLLALVYISYLVMTFTVTQHTWIGKESIERRLPGFIIIGIQKCGTHALATFLQLHPNLVRSSRGEIHYFDSRIRQPLDSYLESMPEVAPHQITYEKTPAYFDYADPGEIKATLPNVKIIVQMCDPVERAMSAFLHHKQHSKHPVNATFESVVMTKNGKIKRNSDEIIRGIYINHILGYYKHFLRENILLLDSADLKVNPASVLQKVEKFLDIPSYFNNGLFYMNDMFNMSCVCPKFVPNGTDLGPNGCLPRRKYRKHPPMSPILRNKLKYFYGPFNRRLCAISGVNFSWATY